MNHTPKPPGPSWIESVAVETLDWAKSLIERGRLHRLVIRKPNGERFVTLPLMVATAIGVLLLLATPLLSAVAAVAALLAQVRVEIERNDGLD
jgi:hypothetical protein